MCSSICAVKVNGAALAHSVRCDLWCWFSFFNWLFYFCLIFFLCSCFFVFLFFCSPSVCVQLKNICLNFRQKALLRNILRSRKRRKPTAARWTNRRQKTFESSGDKKRIQFCYQNVGLLVVLRKNGISFWLFFTSNNSLSVSQRSVSFAQFVRRSF